MAGSLVILTGAGISAESRLPTFRDAGGLWEGHRLEEVATPEGFQHDPDLVHMHGELLKARCLRYRRTTEWTEDMGRATGCPSCRTQGCLPPHIVWFGETPLEMGRIHTALGRCTHFAAIGTSGQVYPAAGFVEAVPDAARTFEINLEASLQASRFQDMRRGPAAKLVPAWVEDLLAG